MTDTKKNHHPWRRPHFWGHVTEDAMRSSWNIHSNLKDTSIVWEIPKLKLGKIGQFDDFTKKLPPEADLWKAVIIHLARDAAKARDEMKVNPEKGTKKAMEIANYLWTEDFEEVCDLARCSDAKIREVVIKILDGRLVISWSGYKKERT